MKLVDIEQTIIDLKAMRAQWRTITLDGVIKHLEGLPVAEPGSTRPTQSNNPLTLEELREMDGEPVWCAVCNLPKGGYYCLCDSGVIMTPSGRNFDCKDISDWKFYRRKPDVEKPPDSPLSTEVWAEHFKSRFERLE